MKRYATKQEEIAASLVDGDAYRACHRRRGGINTGAIPQFPSDPGPHPVQLHQCNFNPFHQQPTKNLKIQPRHDHNNPMVQLTALVKNKKCRLRSIVSQWPSEMMSCSSG